MWNTMLSSFFKKKHKNGNHQLGSNKVVRGNEVFLCTT